MGLRLGDDVPDFTAASTEGKLSLYEYLGSSWGIIFSHPGAFTPVCTTELGQVAKLKEEFDKRDVKVIGLTTDKLSQIIEWVKDINETQGCTVNFPIVADSDYAISSMYGMIHPKASTTFTVRSLYIIAPNREVKLEITYPASVGRNFDEIIRALDGLKLNAEHGLATPANWKQGEDVIVMPTTKTEDAINKFPKGVTVIKPYLRYTPQPE
ncbi:MAG: peroxiredoxin [Chitinophagia bacterium]|jgi:alkyl hydroperoxide reductase subunit AhpC